MKTSLTPGTAKQILWTAALLPYCPLLCHAAKTRWDDTPVSLSLLECQGVHCWPRRSCHSVSVSVYVGWGGGIFAGVWQALASCFIGTVCFSLVAEGPQRRRDRCRVWLLVWCIHCPYTVTYSFSHTVLKTFLLLIPHLHLLLTWNPSFTYSFFFYWI